MPNFETFSAPHLIAMGMTVSIPIALAAIARRRAAVAIGRRHNEVGLSDVAAIARRRAAVAIGYLLAGALLTNEVTNWCYGFTTLGFEQFVKNHLPLHACGIAALATVAALFFRSQRAYEIAYFWGMVGSTNAIITPSLGEGEGFPSYRFFQYFISHSGIVIGVLFATWGLRMRPNLGGLFRAFVCVNLFATGVGIFNLAMGSNYMFLCEPPETASPFFFAPWPWYIPILDIVALGMFFAVFSPFPLSRWWSGRRTADSG